MDISGAKKSVDKLLTYVQDIASADTTLYAKSRGKLKDVAVTCTEVVKVISEILQDEILEEDVTEFQSKSNLSGVIDSMQSQIDQLRQFAGIDQVDVAEGKDVSRPSGLKDNRSPAARKQIFKEYRTCLQELSKTQLGYEEVNVCAELLWEWFDARFLQTVQDSEFKYSMKRFPGWIRDIVILYGYALHEGNTIEFVNEFRLWIDNLSNSTARNKFAVPYDVYQFNRYRDPTLVNLESVVIWDILIHSGLDKICHRNDSFYLTEDSVYEITGELNPASLNSYVDYRDHPEIIESFGWRKEDTIA